MCYLVVGILSCIAWGEAEKGSCRSFEMAGATDILEHMTYRDGFNRCYTWLRSSDDFS